MGGNVNATRNISNKTACPRLDLNLKGELPNLIQMSVVSDKQC